MQRSNLMPFFWAKLVAPALWLGVIASGCAAGGGGSEGRSGDDPTLPPATSASATLRSPALSNPGSSTAPAQGTSINAANTGNAAATTAASNAAETDNAGDEALPTPGIDDGPAPPADDPGDDGSDDDDPGDDGSDDDDSDDDGGDDDDTGDDDDGGDDDDTGDDDDGGDDDDTGVTPAPNPPPGNPGNQTPAPDAITFTADIRPILVTNCGSCHASGGLPQFASANAATGFDVAFGLRSTIISEIRSGNMPADTCNGAPGSSGCVSVADFDSIQQWVASGAPE
jgi:hypothetical protein